ncbi:hypothetical protein TRICI_000682 [Trichomonascus ciferrii]|uniref:FMN-binding negative transcriptional regulator n=1 Tax=Trichomonascus ciferrii TaxID=44093 RepID=A0A642VBM8_9ASCO|nr:hypothetical protein TRICI_000682 [Trichomonascus ciferrii]
MVFIQKPHVVEDIERQVALIEKNSFGTVFTCGPNKGLEANHFPFIVDRDEADPSKITLRAHFAKANKHWQDLEECDECLVVFQGLDEYVSPLWYEETMEKTKKAVPTWDYSAVHVYGKPTLIKDEDWVMQQMNDLTDKFEHLRTEKWSTDDAPEPYIKLLRKAVYGLKIEVTRTEGKWKMSQEKPPNDVRGVIKGLKELGNEPMAADVESANIHSNNL